MTSNSLVIAKTMLYIDEDDGALARADGDCVVIMVPGFEHAWDIALDRSMFPAVSAAIEKAIANGNRIDVDPGSAHP